MTKSANNFLKIKERRLRLTLYPLIVIGLSACFLFYKYVLQVYPSIIINDLMGVFNINGMELGILSACFFYTYVIVQIFSGMLVDRFSIRYLTSIAIIISALGVLIFSFTDSFFIAKLARGVMGFGVAFATVSYLKMASLLFAPKHFALLAGLMASAAMLGAMCGTIPLSFAVTQFGWRTTLIYCGLFGIILASAFWLIVQENSLTRTTKSENITSFFFGLRKILTNRQNWLISLYCGLAFTPLNVFVSLWGVPFLKEAYYLSSTDAAKEIFFIFIGFAIGAPLIGWFSTRFIKRHKIMIVCTILMFFTLSTVIYSPIMPSIFLRLLLFIFGFSTSSFMLGFDVVRELNPPTLIATTVAFINSFEALWSGISEPVVGMLLDFYWTGKIVDHIRVFSIQNYQIAFSILLIYLIVALFLLLFIHDTKNEVDKL